LFFNAFVLPIVYTLLFLYIRRHLKTLRTATTNEYDEDKPLQTDLENNKPASSTSSNEIFVTTSVKVTSENRPGQKQGELSNAERSKRRMNKIAVTLLCYPLAYLCLTMPISITRVAIFCGADVSNSVSYLVIAIFGSSGWVNVLLYTIPRKGLVSWDTILFWRRGGRAYPKQDSAMMLTGSYFPQSASAHPCSSTCPFDASHIRSVPLMQRRSSEKSSYTFDYNSNQQPDPPTSFVAVPDRAKLKSHEVRSHILRFKETDQS
jgi:hypothetical protein